MKRFTKEVQSARQGELYFIRIAELPKDAKQAEPVDGQYIIGHSETGHHHVVKDRPNVKFYHSDEPLVSYLEVVEATDAAETVLEHLREFHTHEGVQFDPGIFAVVTGRESVPDGWRRVAD